MRDGRRLVVGITGASGIEYGVCALRRLRELGVESHLVVSRAGGMTRAVETDLSAQDLRGLADVAYSPGDGGRRSPAARSRPLGCSSHPAR